MSSAKAALESDTRVRSSTFLSCFLSFLFFLIALLISLSNQVLAFEAGRKNKIRVNTISAGNLNYLFFFIEFDTFKAPLLSCSLLPLPFSLFSGPLRSRAAKAIGFIDMMIDYSLANAPLQKELSAGSFFFFSLHHSSLLMLSF